MNKETKDPTGSSSRGIYFPQLRTGSRMSMTALLQGKLVVREGCVRVIGDNGEKGHLVIWQPDYVLTISMGMVEILDRSGKVIEREGAQILIGGGEVELTEELREQLREPVPEGCEGPYWLMGDVVSVE